MRRRRVVNNSERESPKILDSLSCSLTEGDENEERTSVIKEEKQSAPSEEKNKVPPNPSRQSLTETTTDHDERFSPTLVRTSSAELHREGGDYQSNSFSMAKWSIIRLLSFVYFVAFLSAWNQNRGLFGDDGLVPASTYFERVRSSSNPSSAWEGFRSHPTVFWWIELADSNLNIVTLGGLIISSLVLFLGWNSWMAMLTLWLLDFSMVTIADGTSFYSYGWESQLLETGFLAIFLCDLPSVVFVRHNDNKDNGEENNRTHQHRRWAWQIFSRWTIQLRNIWRDDNTSATAISPPSISILWLFRWLCFRISLGAGLIKLRGGSCWTKKTCLFHHFETQPLPSPLSFAFHFFPKWMLRNAVDLDFFVQLYSSWMVLVPSLTNDTKWGQTILARVLCNMRRFGGFVQAAFMIMIILSGNFSFLNHLTIIPALACLDDVCWPRWLRVRVLRHRNQQRLYIVTNDTSKRYEEKKMDKNLSSSDAEKIVRYTRLVFDLSLVTLIGTLSVPVIANLLQWGGTRQQMNASFNAFRLVNTYGAFGSVGESRFEPIISVSSDGGQTWYEVDLPCKPGTVTRRPCFCAPYHYRLDWNIWFIGFKPHRAMLQRRERWLYTLLAKILELKKEDFANANRRPPWLELLDSTSAAYLRDMVTSENGYEDGTQPSWRLLAKVDMYRYEMAAPLWVLAPQWLLQERTVIWWKRTFEEILIPPVVLDPRTKQLRLAPGPD